MQEFLAITMRLCSELSQKVSNISRIMQFKVTAIEFDFEDDWENLPPNQLTKEEQSEIVDEAIGQIWEAEDDDDLVEEITAATGWCINSIEFVNIES
jgi:hypothetical protein